MNKSAEGTVFLRRIFLSAVTTLVLVLVVILVVVLILVLVAILVVVLILISVLVVIHCFFLRNLIRGYAAVIVCPLSYDLSFGLKMMLAISPAVIAAVIPPAVAFSPPVRIPRNPSCAIASFTPFERL